MSDQPDSTSSPPASRVSPLGKMLLLTAGVLLVACGGIVGTRHLRARQHLQIARMALEREDLDLARQHLDKSLQFRDDDPAIHLLAATTARRCDDYDRADAYLKTYERLQPQGGKICLERELLIAQQGDPDSVRVHLESVSKNHPDQAATILEALGKGYLNRFVKKDALTCFNALLKIQPDHAAGLLWRGKTYESLERFDKAELDNRRAVELSPALDKARLRLATLLHRLGRSWEAIPHYECVLLRKPNDQDALLGLALCRSDLNELGKARECLHNLLAANPDHAAALLELGRLEYHAGQTADAEKRLQRAAALSPHDEDTHRALLMCLQKQGKESEARLCLELLEKIDAQLRELDGLMQKLKYGRRDARSLWEIGECLRRLGRDDDAASYYFAALGEEANYSPAHAALADFFQRTGQSYRAALIRGDGRGKP